MLSGAELGRPGGWEPVVQAPQLLIPSPCRMQVLGKRGQPGKSVTSLETEGAVRSTRVNDFCNIS